MFSSSLIFMFAVLVGGVLSIERTTQTPLPLHTTTQTATQLTLVETNGCPQKVYNLMYAFFGSIILVYSLLFYACISCIKHKLIMEAQEKIIAEPSIESIVWETHTHLRTDLSHSAFFYNTQYKIYEKIINR